MARPADRDEGFMRVRFGFAVLMVGMLALAGCTNAVGGRKAMVVADYPGLQDKSLAIVVYTAQANMDEFPGTRKDISSFVANQFRLHMPTTRLLNFDDVISWQDDTINWFALPEKDIGKHFSVDRVLYIEVLTYEAKNANSYGDLQGHLRANCKIFEVDSPGNSPAWSGVIDVSWPRDKPLPPNQGSEVMVRSRTLQGFAAELVGHFYTRQADEIPLQER
jgi:hypothetical protein